MGLTFLKIWPGDSPDEFGRGFSVANLKNFRQFFLVFPRGCREEDIPPEEIGYTVCSGLSWSHYRLLMRVEDPAARGYYIGEAISQNWSVRALLAADRFTLF
jgi:hypothetical protein